MRVIRSSRAEEDLVEIWLYVAKDSPKAADRVLDALERKIKLLAQHSQIGRARPDIAMELRYVTAGEYLILYRVVGDQVEIVRYVHGRRDLKRMI